MSVEAFVRPGSHHSAPSTSPRFPFCCHRDFRSVGAFFFLAVCCRMQKCQIWGEFPSLTPFQPCGGGREGRGHLTISFGRQVASSGAQASVSLESACPRAPPCFPTLSEPEIQATVSQQSKELRERPRTREAATASPGIGMLRVSTDIPQLPVPGVCAGLGQAPLLRGFAGSRRVLGSVPPFKASPDLDSLPARAPPPGSALPPLLPAAGRGPAERAGLLLLMPVASAPAERGASLCRPIQPYRPFPARSDSRARGC